MRYLGFSVLRAVNAVLRENAFKNRVRRLVLRFKVNIPRELMINSGETVVQVGTPKIETLERLSRSAGAKGRVLIIEPNADNVARLQAHMAQLKTPNVTLVPKAAWNGAGTMEMLVSQRYAGNHRLNTDRIVHDNDIRELKETGGYETTLVEVDTVEHIARSNDISRAGYIEIAVNGAEYEVLEGVGELLGRTDRLFVKGHARESDTGQPINIKIRRFLAEHGFDTTLTKPAASHSAEWGDKEGDVYGWR